MGFSTITLGFGRFRVDYMYLSTLDELHANPARFKNINDPRTQHSQVLICEFTCTDELG